MDFRDGAGEVELGDDGDDEPGPASYLLPVAEGGLVPAQGVLGEVTRQIYGHLVPASLDRARTVLDDARRATRHPPTGNPPENPC